MLPQHNFVCSNPSAVWGHWALFEKHYAFQKGMVSSIHFKNSEYVHTNSHRYHMELV